MEVYYISVSNLESPETTISHRVGGLPFRFFKKKKKLNHRIAQRIIPTPLLSDLRHKKLLDQSVNTKSSFILTFESFITAPCFKLEIPIFCYWFLYFYAKFILVFASWIPQKEENLWYGLQTYVVLF